MGGELEYIDGSTLMHSLSGRQVLSMVGKVDSQVDPQVDLKADPKVDTSSA
jgi:hypothetical protein